MRSSTQVRSAETLVDLAVCPIITFDILDVGTPATNVRSWCIAHGRRSCARPGSGFTWI